MSLSNKLICYYVYLTVAGNPDFADMLPHIRGQGMLDLEYEADGNHKL